MTKRILSVALVLAMLVSVLPVSGVSAEVSDVTLTQHTHSDAHTCSAQCAGGTVTWTAWDKTDSLPAESGHYYLTADVQMTAAQDTAAGQDITICLNGYNIRSASGKRIGYVYGKLTIADCTAYEKDGQYISGSVVGSSAADGAVLSVRRDGTLVLEGGKLTGGTTTGTAGGGGVYLQKGTSAGAGGVFYMYGGEISGNEGQSGGGVCIGGADSGCVYPAFYMYGGTITGNHARGNGGGVYAVSRSTVEITNGTITGNTTAGKAASVYMDGGYSKLTVSGAVQLDGVHFVNSGNPGLKVNNLTNGTQITMITTVAEGAEADITKTVSLASGGTQNNWSAHWITANGQSVSMVDGAFTFGHFHGTTEYNAWTGTDSHNTLPNGSKSYYLANDIMRNTNGGAITIETSTTQHLCLNGYTITHRNPSGRLYNIKGSFTLEDCSAYTDADGNYVSGGITYAGASASATDNGMFANVSRGATMTVTGGQIYGFESSLASSKNGSLIYVQGANTTAKAVFNLQGGQIHSNTSATNGAVILVMKADPAATTMDTYTQINISGGKIWGNTSTSGGIIAAVSNHINITGGTITDNTVKKGAVYGRNENNISVSGAPTIYGNNGGNLYLTDSRLLNVGELTGGKIGIGASQIDRTISNAITAEEFAYFESDNSEILLSHVDECLYLGTVETHIHGLDGKDGDLSWSKWTSTDSLPTDAGNYYLENDVQLTAAVTIAADVKLCLNGKTVTAAAGKRVLSANSGAVVTITDCCETCGTITGGNSNYGGALNVSRGATLNLYNGLLTGNASEDKDNGVGGAIYLQAANAYDPGAILNMYGGVITGNKAAKGGAIGTGDGVETAEALAQINIYGGQIYGNTASNNGGAIRTGKYCQVTIDGVDITGNTSGAYGGAIYIGAYGDLSLKNCAITGNTAKTAADGVYFHKDANTFSLDGKVQVSENKNSNIYLCGEKTLTIGQLLDGSVLFVSADGGDRAITGQLEEAESAYFHCDSTYRMLTYKDGALWLEVSDAHSHCLCFAQTQGCDHQSVKWQAWESTNSLPTASGYYYLLADVQMTAAQAISGGADVHLCLNGKTVTAAENSRILQVQADSKLSVTDCGSTGTITGGNRTYGGAINVNRKGQLDLFGGTFTGNVSLTEEGLGGAIYVQAANATENGGVFNMYGGLLTGNEANKGGAIGTGDGVETTAALAQINIYGGQITDNKASNNGGAIRTGTYAEVNIYGGTISGNHCETRGGAIYIGKSGKLNVQGGAITKNTTVSNGAAIYTLSETIISGGEITNNVSGSDGGALFVSGANLVISGGTFSGNKVTKGAGGAIGISSLCQAVITGGTITGNTAANGGAIIVQGGADLTIKGGTISKNEATIYAGAIYVNVPGKSTGDVSVLKLEGGTITQNKAVKNGGGIYITEAEFVMTGGTISKNESPAYGGGLFAIRTTSKISGGTISGNTSEKDGAGAYFNAGTAQIGGNILVTDNNSLKGAGGGLGFTKECKATLSGGTITNNIAGNAGGIIVQGQAHLTMTGGAVKGNKTRASGGGIYVNKGSADFLGGTLEGNTAVKNGGGLYTNDATLTFAGTSFVANKATGSAGGMFVSKSKATFTGGTVADNSCDRYAGGVYLNDSESTLENMKITGNSGAMGSGGFHCYKGTVTMTNLEITGNHSDTSAGGVYATQLSQVVLNDCLVEGNTSPRGAGVMANARATMTLNNVVIRNNEAVEGGGVYVNSNVENFVVNGGEISGNIAKKRLSTTNTMILGVGAGIYVNTGTKTSTGHSRVYINGTVIRDNQAEGIGGGAYVNKQMHLYLDGCTIENNTSGDMGGGIYQSSGSYLYVKNTDIIGNVSAGNGSAIYAGSDFELDGGTITGNKTTDGTAVYVAPARYDGQSYANATVKLGGDLVIFDNEGTMEGDLYLDEGVAAAGTIGGFGENTKVKIQLHSGLLTDNLLAAYNYEGGNCIYTVTYGNRSLTEPEYVAPEKTEDPETATEGEEAQSGDTMLYVAIGAIAAVLLLAAAAVVIVKKKKAGKATQE